MHVFLIGFMGCGKTTLGKKLARKLNWEFIDLDKTIENSERKSVQEIFNTMGEDQFREYEILALQKIIDINSNIIVSTGGGTPCHFNNMHIMNKQGITIYLKTNVGMLAHRLRNSKKKRPLIENLSAVALNAYIVKKLAEREHFYQQAGYEVETKDLDLMQVVDIINEAMKKKK